MTCLYLRGRLGAPAFSATLKTQGALAAAACFSGRKSCILPHAHQCSNGFFFRLILYRLCFFRRLSLYANYCAQGLQCSHCLRLLCCGRRDQLKESGHVRSAPWTSTAGRRPYYVQFRQEARAAGAVASDGDLAAHSQIVGSEESTTRS
jgi:hypothetical protein